MTDEQEHIVMFLDTTKEETEHVSVEHERLGLGWLDSDSGDEVEYSYRCHDSGTLGRRRR